MPNRREIGTYQRLLTDPPPASNYLIQVMQNGKSFNLMSTPLPLILNLQVKLIQIMTASVMRWNMLLAQIQKIFPANQKLVITFRITAEMNTYPYSSRHRLPEVMYQLLVKYQMTWSLGTIQLSYLKYLFQRTSPQNR